MEREELIKSKEYWFATMQVEIYGMVYNYMKENHLSRKQLSKVLGVSMRFVSKILSADINLRIEDLVSISVKIGKRPILTFENN